MLGAAENNLFPSKITLHKIYKCCNFYHNSTLNQFYFKYVRTTVLQGSLDTLQRVQFLMRYSAFWDLLLIITHHYFLLLHLKLAF